LTVPYTPVDLIEVRAWGRTVGALIPGRARAYAFEYDPAWVRSGVELAPIIMPLARQIYSFPNLNPDTFQWLPPMIADSLPDRYGNGLIDAWMARNGVIPGQITALDRLAYLGRRGLGALEFEPDNSPNTAVPSAIDMRELVETARRAVHGTLDTDATSAAALEGIISVGTSAGGARAKAIINYNPQTEEARSGHISPEEGFQPWLIKFDGIGTDRQLGHTQVYGRIEYAYSLMAGDAGIRMSETRLLRESGRAHFMTKRFDREGDHRLHMQSLCALAAVDFNATATNDYTQYFSAIRELGLADAELAQAFRRMVFNVAASNCDDHSKNFAFLMDETGVWSLAPAFDITYAYNPASEWTHQHLMSVNGKFVGITKQDIIDVADRFDISGAAAVITEVEDVTQRFAQFADIAGIPAESVAEIETGITALRRR
jgi:serine/threonine-protein kinase HipA